MGIKLRLHGKGSRGMQMLEKILAKEQAEEFDVFLCRNAEDKPIGCRSIRRSEWHRAVAKT
jgi:hypothetical protein